MAGSFPFTAGVFAFKRENEDPTRMFAGEGDPFSDEQSVSTCLGRRHAGQAVVRGLRCDSVTLYGNDPDPRPDIYGKVGNSGVSIATLDDMKVLYSGFDLCAPNNSSVDDDQRPGVPTLLAMFMNTAIDQQADQVPRRHTAESRPTTRRRRSASGRCPIVRGTVQADILKEE